MALHQFLLLDVFCAMLEIGTGKYLKSTFSKIVIDCDKHQAPITFSLKLITETDLRGLHHRQS